MRYSIVHPDGESTEHSRILFAQEYDGYLSVIYEHVSIKRGVTRLWLVTSSYSTDTQTVLSVTQGEVELTTWTLKSCEYGQAPNATDNEIAQYSGNLINARSSV